MAHVLIPIAFSREARKHGFTHFYALHAIKKEISRMKTGLVGGDEAKEAVNGQIPRGRESRDGK